MTTEFTVRKGKNYNMTILSRILLKFFPRIIHAYEQNSARNLNCKISWPQLINWWSLIGEWGFKSDTKQIHYDNNFETFDTEEHFVERLTKRPDACFVEIPDFRGDPIPCFNTSKRFVCTKYMKLLIKVYIFCLSLFQVIKVFIQGVSYHIVIDRIDGPKLVQQSLKGNYVQLLRNLNQVLGW